MGPSLVRTPERDVDPRIDLNRGCKAPWPGLERAYAHQFQQVCDLLHRYPNPALPTRSSLQIVDGDGLAAQYKLPAVRPAKPVVERRGSDAQASRCFPCG